MVEKKPTILIIEDDYTIRNLVETILTENGFVTIGFESAETALKRIPSIKPSLILLDIQLSGMNGLECCKKIRSDPHSKGIPIIFLSVHSSDGYKITGLEAGGDDFITKPFSHGELLARVKAVLRRTEKIKTPSNHLVQDELFALDLESHIATLNKKRLALSPKEFALLILFVKSEGKVLSRDVLSTEVWEHENLATSRTIDAHVARLRKKLGKFYKVIQTVGKVGYRYSIHEQEEL